ncbi:MAG: hypothetical protein E4H01_06765 [Lysobacterales bacterium]|nr:MAG: hypothetical protein E4H01_06765 [Xanthomonadales bacterium]
MLASLQRQLERIYEIKIPHSVEDFLITDIRLLNDLQGNEKADQSEIEEQLLVIQDGDSVDIALFVDNEIVNRLTQDDPRSRLHAGNLSDYCTAMEGVSHFLYLIWNAGHKRGVSLMELEMQAEIDKYVSTAFLFGKQGSGRIPSNLYRWLFDKPVFNSSLDRTSLERYRDANYYASKYCARLENRYLKRTGQSGMFNDLRRLYRLTNHAKISCAVAEH